MGRIRKRSVVAIAVLLLIGLFAVVEWRVRAALHSEVVARTPSSLLTDGWSSTHVEGLVVPRLLRSGELPAFRTQFFNSWPVDLVELRVGEGLKVGRQVLLGRSPSEPGLLPTSEVVVTISAANLSARVPAVTFGLGPSEAGVPVLSVLSIDLDELDLHPTPLGGLVTGEVATFIDIELMLQGGSLTISPRTPVPGLEAVLEEIAGASLPLGIASDCELRSVETVLAAACPIRDLLDAQQRLGRVAEALGP